MVLCETLLSYNMLRNVVHINESSDPLSGHHQVKVKSLNTSHVFQHQMKELRTLFSFRDDLCNKLWISFDITLK